MVASLPELYIVDRRGPRAVEWWEGTGRTIGRGLGGCRDRRTRKTFTRFVPVGHSLNRSRKQQRIVAKRLL